MYVRKSRQRFLFIDSYGSFYFDFWTSARGRTFDPADGYFESENKSIPRVSWTEACWGGRERTRIVSLRFFATVSRSKPPFFSENNTFRKSWARSWRNKKIYIYSTHPVQLDADSSNKHASSRTRERMIKTPRVRLPGKLRLKTSEDIPIDSVNSRARRNDDICGLKSFKFLAPVISRAFVWNLRLHIIQNINIYNI